MANSATLDITKMIEGAVKQAVNKAVEEVLKDATGMLEDKLRENVAGIALGVMNHYSIERFGSDIRITVKNEYKA